MSLSDAQAVMLNNYTDDELLNFVGGLYPLDPVTEALKKRLEYLLHGDNKATYQELEQQLEEAVEAKDNAKAEAVALEETFAAVSDNIHEAIEMLGAANPAGALELLKTLTDETEAA